MATPQVDELMRGVNWDVFPDVLPGPTRTRHPFEVFTLCLALTSGLSLLVVPAPGTTLEAMLPDWARIAWALLLVAGSGIALLGVWWPRRVTGIVVEQYGLALTGMATLFYAAVLAIHIGTSAVIAMIYVLGFGVSCLWRWFQLQQLIGALHRMGETFQDEGEHRDGR